MRKALLECVGIMTLALAIGAPASAQQNGGKGGGAGPAAGAAPSGQGGTGAPAAAGGNRGGGAPAMGNRGAVGPSVGNRGAGNRAGMNGNRPRFSQRSDGNRSGNWNRNRGNSWNRGYYRRGYNYGPGIVFGFGGFGSGYWDDGASWAYGPYGYSQECEQVRVRYRLRNGRTAYRTEVRCS